MLRRAVKLSSPIYLLVAGSLTASAYVGGTLPVSSSIRGTFTCPKTSISVEVRHRGETAQLASLAIDGRPAAPATLAAMRKALSGLTRVTGISARCHSKTPGLAMIAWGHAATAAARAINKLDDNDVGIRMIIEQGKLISVETFPWE